MVRTTMDLFFLKAACFLVAICLLLTTVSSFFYSKSPQNQSLEYGVKTPMVEPFHRMPYAESPAGAALTNLSLEATPLAWSHALKSASSDTAAPQKPLRTGADAVVVAFDSQGNEVLDVPDTSNSMLDQPFVTGNPAVIVGDVLEAVDDTNWLLAAPQITGVDAVETLYESGSVLEVNDWPLVYEATVTGAPAREIYDPVTGDTVID